uniref:Protein kinase domain-containing protein n=1 Tax=Oryza punctata TaxID=4537 RepID=A0A0E0MKB3_ORYPU
MKLRSSMSRRAPPPMLALPAPPQLGSARGWAGRTVVVGVRDDAEGRELLTWALAMVASAGDRVVALHVATPAAAVADQEGAMKMAARRIRATESLAALLRAYHDFCDLNQISLELRICHGSSIKKTLVNEASSYGAAHLILGVTNNSRSHLRPSSSSSSTTVAKYCEKRVPPSCSVLAVVNGRVVYRRDASQQQLNQCISPLVETPRRIYRKLVRAATMINREKSQDDTAIAGGGRHLRRNISTPTSAPVSPVVAFTPRQARSPEVAAGWPLLSPDLKSALPEWTEMSVARWAMHLPSRCPALSPLNPCKNSGDQATSPAITASETPSPAIDDAAEQVAEELASLRNKYSSKYTMFSYSELARITCNFSPDQIIGKGGASEVYKGCCDDGKEVAVKVLKSSDKVIEELVSEMEIVSSVRHDNAMPLTGFCLDDGGELMLVYDYMARGSLEEILHGEKEGKYMFGWPERFKVAAGVARALVYLHGGDGNGRPVIHRDVKSSNILVSEDFQPKLCDFGLALWAAEAASPVTGDDIAGTFGYLAPEYFMHGKVSDKIDVYAFGVVLLELVSGRKPVSSGGGKGKESLVMWANTIIQGGKLTDLVDPSLPTDDGGEVERMTLAAALCIRRSPQRRPSIANVLNLLDGDGDAVRWARSQAGLSAGDDGDVDSPEKKDIQSYINLALLDVDDDSASVSSGGGDFTAANVSLEEYMKGRWSRSSSFD